MRKLKEIEASVNDKVERIIADTQRREEIAQERASNGQIRQLENE